MKLNEIVLEAASQFEKLKNNKVPLTSEEREECKKRKAFWGDGRCAVWKSYNPNTKKTTYVTHTHRVYNTAPTLKGAISRFHNFVKSTA